MKKLRIFRCNICGSVVVLMKGNTNTLACCGEYMEELFPKYIDELKEKHIPVIREFSNVVIVDIGEVSHPMMEKHYIEWILIQTNLGYRINYLNCNSQPKTEFLLLPDEYVEKVYSYCNIHGLWVKDVKK